jgi:DNA replication protein DnaC
VLFIDELGKEKMTDRVESEFMWVLDQRCSWKRPMFITTNLMGEQFKQIWSRDRASAILGRFKEFFQWVSVVMRDEQPMLEPQKAP